jgi:hypothetical protein
MKILTIEYSKNVVIQLGNLGAMREAYKIKIIYNTALTYLFSKKLIDFSVKVEIELEVEVEVEVGVSKLGVNVVDKLGL